jgi:integrase
MVFVTLSVTLEAIVAKELTAVAIEKMKPGDARQEIPDGRISGLYFIIQPSGKRSWAVRYRFGGVPVKLTLGAYPAIDLKRARELAGEAKDKVEEGQDPSAEKKARKAATAVPASDTVDAAAERFLSQYVRRNLKPSTISEVDRIMNKVIIPAWKGHRLSEIRRPDIHDLLDSIVDQGSPVAANRTLSWFRRMCSWAIERGLIETNPCTGIKPPAAETARDRVLSDGELAAVWRAADALDLTYSAFIRVLILTGQRRSEVAGMTWREIDLDAKLWTLPAARAKNGREHKIPLSDLAVEILRSLPWIADSRFVFSLFGRGPITAFVLTKQRLDALMPTETAPWTLHDLRRTFASGCARLGVAVHVVEAALNHRSGSIKGVAAVYNRYSYDTEKRAALSAWARHVETIVTGAPDNVITLRRGV